MATLPSATTIIDDSAGALASGVDTLVVLAPVAVNADGLPRVFSSLPALLAKHGYSQGAAYCELHLAETKKPVIFVPMPIVTAGTIYQEDDGAVTGTSAITVTAGDDGVLEQVHGILTVTTGGTIEADAIRFDLSLDGGRTTKSIRLGTNATYTIPYLGIVLNFSAGTLVADDVFEFRTTAPRGDQAGLTAARTALAAQSRQQRSWLLVGDLLTEDDATNLVTEVNTYETENQRFVYARAQARDIRADAALTGAATLTFAEVGATGDTITRSTGSWIDDGFEVGMIITVEGTASNNVTGPIAALSATVITMGTTDLVAEAAVADAAVVGVEAVVDWTTDIAAEFADIDGEKRIDIAAGYARKLSPLTGWRFRRPAAWAVSIREYQHDVHVATWRKDIGPLSGWDLEDADGNTVEHDANADASLLDANFTCLRTYPNGPNGTFVAMSLTRAEQNSLLSRTHNLAVANIACSVNQAETENMIGVDLVLKTDGTATAADLEALQNRVDSALAIALLQRGPEGPRASSASWEADASSVLNTVGATLDGELSLGLKGTIEKIRTRVRVQSAV